MRRHYQLGLGLTELMICATLGLLIILAAISLLVSTRAAFSTHDEARRMTETGHYVLDTLARALRQAGLDNWARPEGALVATSEMSAAIIGLDARSLRDTVPALDASLASTLNGSDVLAVRYFGSGSEPGDGTVLNCAGASVPAPEDALTEAARSWSIFYLAANASGEPELRCKYRARTGAAWDGDAIATGVESFQVLYGLDHDGDGLPDQYLNASAIRALDNQLDSASMVTASHWKKAVTARIGLLVRGTEFGRAGDQPLIHDLFGKSYSDRHAATDVGVRINEALLSVRERKRLRKVFSLTIGLRNIAGVRPVAPGAQGSSL